MGKRGWEFLLISFVLAILSAISVSASAQITTNLLPVANVTQYIYQYDYSSSSVNITYNSDGDTFSGLLSGVNLKPNFNKDLNI